MCLDGASACGAGSRAWATAASSGRSEVRAETRLTRFFWFAPPTRDKFPNSISPQAIRILSMSQSSASRPNYAGADSWLPTTHKPGDMIGNAGVQRFRDASSNGWHTPLLKRALAEFCAKDRRPPSQNRRGSHYTMWLPWEAAFLPLGHCPREASDNHRCFPPAGRHSRAIPREKRS